LRRVYSNFRNQNSRKHINFLGNQNIFSAIKKKRETNERERERERERENTEARAVQFEHRELEGLGGKLLIEETLTGKPIDDQQRRD
jgi:hypothetical protein